MKRATGGWGTSSGSRAPAHVRRGASTVPPGGRDDVLHDREPKARATRGARAVGAIEALEEARQVGLVDPGTVVHDAEHDPLTVTRHGENRVRSRACIADRVLGEVPRDDAQHARPHLGGRVLVALDAERHSRPARPAPRARRRPRAARAARARRPARRPWCPTRARPGRAPRRSARGSGRSRARACSTSAGTSSPGRPASSRSDEQPGERRAQLVRDGGGEAGAQLLVGGEVSRLREVHEPFLAAVDAYGTTSARSPLRRSEPSSSPSRTPRDWRARRLAARTTSVLVEDDDRLAALLEQHLSAHTVSIHHGGSNRRPFTTPLPLLHPPAPGADCMMKSWRRF